MKLVLCKWAGCNQLCVKYYCKKHEAIAQQRRQQQLKLFSGQRKQSGAYNHLYQTSSWRKLRKEYLNNNPFCVMCGNVATVVDHIIAHQGNEDLFNNINNLQSLCASCHTKKTLEELRQRKKD